MKAFQTAVFGLVVGLMSACGSLGRTGDDLGMHATLAVTRGDLVVPVMLTGELAADKSRVISAPRTETFELSIRWLADDGAEVEQGDRLVEFDDTALLDAIGGWELAVLDADNEWDNFRAQQAVEVAEKRFAAREATVEVSKTEIDARVSEDILSRMQYSEYQLALGRAKLARDAAGEDAKTASSGAKLEDKVQALAYAKAERKYESAKREIAALTITAPQDGVMIVPDNPFEGRKLQVGDTVFPGFTVAELPDLSKMVVRAVLSDVDDGSVHPGMKVTCFLDAYPERELSGLVRSVSPVAREPERGSVRRFFAVVIELDETDQSIMRPGLSVRAEVESLRRADVLLIPRAALTSGSEGTMAQLEDGSQVVVEIGACDARRCELRSGLDEGARLGIAPPPASERVPADSSEETAK
ncbi:efflux RND transporter periplasmic adaptor subunit [Enhygromyxa salina]|uniref:Putative efflux pump membrane fusion protein n=1 Tax=Enhygromyxa salina TaxID=215803 RepID=A0A2S9YM23_9BACT|nr:efflux RND transporter periplasmic adaptor subunit [Enhygromyxa salina]PRQ06076.1 putative efflux pump membrane fusion protein [Enhygromyxa salina]